LEEVFGLTFEEALQDGCELTSKKQTQKKKHPCEKIVQEVLLWVNELNQEEWFFPISHCMTLLWLPKVTEADDLYSTVTDFARLRG
jgi:hypothetical protein